MIFKKASGVGFELLKEQRAPGGSDGVCTGTMTKMAEVMANEVRGRAGAGIVEIERALRFQHYNGKVTPLHLAVFCQTMSLF